MQNKTIHIFHFCSHFELVKVNSNTLPIRCRCWHQWVHYLSIIAAVTIVSLKQKRPKIQIQLLITIYVKLSIFWRLYEIKWREWRVVDERTTDVHAYNSGAPSRAKRAWDRAPYSWNMVNLFSFGCQVTDRAYVRTYASTDCTGRVGESIKREGCLRRVLASPHL